MLPAGNLGRDPCRTRDVESSDHTVWSAQETVKHTARIRVASRDRASRGDAKGGCALPGAVPRWSIECGDGAVLVAEETVKRIAAVNVESRD